MKSKRLNSTVKSLDDIAVKYSETCDIDHIYDVNVLDKSYKVSVRYDNSYEEADVLILGDDEDVEIGFIPLIKNMTKYIKTVVLSYLVGHNEVKIEGKTYQ